MALYEKKNILRGMYTRPDPNPTPSDQNQAAAIAAANGTPPKSPLLDARLEKILKPLLRAAAFLPILIGLLALAWPLITHYLQARAFRESPSPERYIQEAFITIGAIVFVTLLGILAFFGLKDYARKSLRWILLGLTLALIPIAFVSMFFGPLARSLGTKAGYNAIDGTQLLAASAEIARTLPVANWDVRTITPFDAEWTLLPPYIRESIKPQRLNIYARGITLDLEIDPYGYAPPSPYSTTTPSTPRSGLAILHQSQGQLPYNNSDLDRFAARHHYSRSPIHDGTDAGTKPGGLRPILRYTNRGDEFEELRDGTNPTPTLPPGTPTTTSPAGVLITPPTGHPSGSHGTQESKKKDCTCEG